MDPGMINCMILRIHEDKIITIPSHAIQQQPSVSARYGSKKNLTAEILNHLSKILGSNPTEVGRGLQILLKPLLVTTTSFTFDVSLSQMLEHGQVKKLLLL